MKINLNNVKLVVSAVSKAQYPVGNLPEIALAGRSNVGKSSLINSLLNRKSFARVSGTPGKTATINFYNVDDKLYLVDLPGYGYAQVSATEKQKWAKMINEYLESREQLTQVISLVDSRHKPTKDDVTMYDWIIQSGYSGSIVATKADKLKATERKENPRRILEALEADELLLYSAKTHEGRDELWEKIEREVLGEV